MCRLPAGVPVGIAEARHPERGRVREGLAKVSRSGTGADRLLERGDDPVRILTEQLLSKRGVARPPYPSRVRSEQTRSSRSSPHTTQQGHGLAPGRRFWRRGPLPSDR